LVFAPASLILTNYYLPLSEALYCNQMLECELDTEALTGILFSALIILGFFAKLITLYRSVKDTSKYVDEQCKIKGITTKSEIKSFKRHYYINSYKSAFRVIFIILIPVILFFLYIWFLISIK